MNPSTAVLTEWARTIRVEALKALAEDMAHVRDAPKAEVIEWLLEHERGRLIQSYRLTTGLAR